MPTYRVYYAKREHMRQTLVNPQRVTRETLVETHEPVMLLHSCETHQLAFSRMQGEMMTPQDAQKVASIAGRTSMSVGDALYRLDGTILVVGHGAQWHEHPPQAPIYPPTEDEDA